MMQILLTGFEPFAGSQINPSERVVQALAGRYLEGLDLATTILPVDTFRAPSRLTQALEETQPEAVVCLGEASRRAALSIERVAVNLLDFRIPDNQGVQVVDEPVLSGGPAAYFSTLPVRRLLQALQEAGVPAELSLSAGSYLCNQVFYVLLDYLQRQGRPIPAGFIHLPALTQQAAEQAALGKPAIPSMSLETMLRGLETVLFELRRVQPG
jgi:pyroglutamyl-peptidase